MADSADPVVLVVDDDPQVGRLYAEFLADQYEVTLVESGDAALEAMSSTIDVVLLDRRMPGLSGNDVLEQLRENGYDQPVAIITAVEPDFDILKMGFDDYVVKPVTGDQLCELVETILLRKEYDSLVRDYFSLVSKVTALEQEKSPRELKNNDDYVESVNKLEEIEDQARAALDVAIDEGKFEELYRDLTIEG